MENSCDNFKEIQSTWHKVSTNMENIGYRNGVSDGRDSTFQINFNDGFEEGFKNGFLIGQHKGGLLAPSNHHRHLSSVSGLLEKSTRGWCQLCSQQEVSNLDRTRVINNQRVVTQKNLNELSSIFSQQCNVMQSSDSKQN